jgi:hypothetical protein
MAAVAVLAFLTGLALDPFKTLVANWVEQPARHHASLRAHASRLNAAVESAVPTDAGQRS